MTGISCVGGFGSSSYMYKINGTANINAIRAAAEKASDQPYRRQKTLTAGDLSGDIFRRLPAKSFSDTDHAIRCARRRSSTFLKAPEEESQPRVGHARLFSCGLNLTRQCVRAPGALSGHVLPPPASPDAV
ncbi:hypothetical protein CK203_057089 [Vitis vinifera]|uniref:Uncharacterized protein n=1 Tax=Vitis vinifera TaxID=29760 RepID=A0A438GHR0_VITVI|nr:hypothetical protein CK203_057089 [Vitis vinifera]